MKLDEYSAVQSEILTWIQVEYALIAATPGTALIALAFYRGDVHWPLFAGVLVLVVSSMISITAFVRSKIMLASAYLIVFHDDGWQAELYHHARSHDLQLSSKLHWPATVALYVVTAVAGVGYPFAVSPGYSETARFIHPAIYWGILGLAAAGFFASLAFCRRSYNKDTYLDLWRNIEDRDD